MLFWVNNTLVAQLGADSVEDLTITVTAIKTDPGITLDPPLPTLEPEVGTRARPSSASWTATPSCASNSPTRVPPSPPSAPVASAQLVALATPRPGD